MSLGIQRFIGISEALFRLQELSASSQPPATITYGEELKRKTKYKLPLFKEAFQECYAASKKFPWSKNETIKSMKVGVETSEA